MTAREPVDLDELERLEAAATPGPWEAVEGASGGWWIEQPYRATVAELDIDHKTPEADAEFIAAARNALPDLIRRVREAEEAEAEVERLRAEVEHWKARRNAAIELCRFRHQDGQTAEQWHSNICAAAEGARRERARAEKAEAEVAALRATVERLAHAEAMVPVAAIRAALAAAFGATESEDA